MAEKLEPDAMLAFFDTRIAAWVAAKESYLKAVSLGAPGQVGDVDLSTASAVGVGGPRTPIELPIGAFRSKSIPDAIKLYLSAARRKQTLKEIAAGLKEGGLVTTSTNFEATVTGALHRLKKDGIVLRFKDGWDLAESYPDHIRNKLENGAKPKSKSAAKKQVRSRKARATGRVKTPRNLERRSARPATPSLDQRVLSLMTHSAQHVSPKQVAENLTEDPKLVGMAFARLTRFGKVTKGDDGLYAVARPPVEKLKAV
jgi:hypothetical protein